MYSDKRKKSISLLSVILAFISFLILNQINASNGNNLKSTTSDTEKATASYSGDMFFKENKGVYSWYDPGDFASININVFSTKDKSGKVYDLSHFDLVADWDTEFNPNLDAHVQFVDRGKQPNDQSYIMPNASIRVKGNPSASMKSYRVKFIDGTPGYKGQSVYNLNKHLSDPSRIANKLAHDLIINLDHISGFRTEFLELYIRDDNLGGKDNEFHSYGLYTHIEQPNKAYLRSRGLDENGSLYRAEDFNFQLDPRIKNTSDIDYDKQLFESVLGIREGKDHSKLIKMLTDINDEDKDFDEVFHTYFDEDNYLTWLAINILLGNTDGLSEGFLLYNPSKSSVFYLLPWDFDSIFRWMDEENEIPSIYEQLNNVILHRKYLQEDENVEKLKERVEELRNDAFSPGKVKSLVKLYKPILLEMMNHYPDDILSSISINEQIAYLGQIDERILQNYYEFMKRYE